MVGVGLGTKENPTVDLSFSPEEQEPQKRVRQLTLEQTAPIVAEADVVPGFAGTDAHSRPDAPLALLHARGV